MISICLGIWLNISKMEEVDDLFYHLNINCLYRNSIKIKYGYL